MAYLYLKLHKRLNFTFVGWTDAATIFFIKVMASKNTPFIPAFCDGKMSIKGTHYYFSAKHRTVLFLELLFFRGCFAVFLSLVFEKRGNFKLLW